MVVIDRAQLHSLAESMKEQETQHSPNPHLPEDWEASLPTVKLPKLCSELLQEFVGTPRIVASRPLPQIKI